MTVYFKWSIFISLIHGTSSQNALSAQADLSISLTIYLTKATGRSFASATYMSDIRKPEIFIMA
jgi:hypothetical protein